jgi:hypothetical protein
MCSSGCDSGADNEPVMTSAATTRSSITKAAGDVRKSATAEYSSVPLINSSARGWGLSTQLRETSEHDTIIQAPDGQRFNARYTGMPDYHRPILWILDVPSLKQKFLVLYLYPVASGSSTLSIYLIRDNHIVCKASQIAHHFEWTKETRPSQIIDELFTDQNNDNRPELVECDVGKFGGIVTYHEFNGNTFSPRWRETYKLNERDKISRVSRIDLRRK